MGHNIKQQWILEFLLRQPIEDSVMNRLTSALCPSIHDTRLLKTLILRRVSSELQKGLISEMTLESLELIEEIDHINGIRVLDSMKKSYCLVAMDCTVKFLKTNPKNFSEYSKVIDRIWRGRMLDLERGKEVPLALRRAQDLGSELEKAMHDASVCEHLSMEDTRNEALKLLGIFLEEVTEKMGLPFLEIAAKTMGNKGKNFQPLVNTLIANQAGVGGASPFHDPVDDLHEYNGDVLENNCNKMDAGSSVGLKNALSADNQMG